MPRWLFVVLAVVASGISVAAQMAEQEVAKVEQARMEARRKADSAMLARLSPTIFSSWDLAANSSTRKGSPRSPQYRRWPAAM